jgi:hypothetical protein
MIELVGKMVDGMGRLVTQHITLARIEIVDELKTLGSDAGQIAAFAPFLAVGYVLWCGAAVALLATKLGWAWGFFIVGTVNVAVGAVGVLLGVKRLRAKAGEPVLDASLAEMKNTAAALAHPRDAAHIHAGNSLEVSRAK